MIPKYKSGEWVVWVGADGKVHNGHILGIDYIRDLVDPDTGGFAYNVMVKDGFTELVPEYYLVSMLGVRRNEPACMAHLLNCMGYSVYDDGCG